MTDPTPEGLDVLVKLAEEFVTATWHLLDNSETSGPIDDPTIAVWKPDFDEVSALLDRCEGLPSGSTEHMTAGKLLAANMTAAITAMRAQLIETTTERDDAMRLFHASDKMVRSLRAQLAEAEAALTQSRTYALALEQEMRDRIAIQPDKTKLATITGDRSEIDRLVGVLRKGRHGADISNEAADMIEALAEAEFNAVIAAIGGGTPS